MFDLLTDNLQNIFNNLRGKITITEENIDSAIREVRRALIGADVSLKAIKTFTNKVRDKAIGQEIIKGIKPSEQFIKIVYDEMVDLLGGGEDAPAGRLNVDTSPSTILVLGLQGSGKTTTCAKLANFLKKKGKNPLLVPLDLKRPAAVEQLQTLGRQIDIPVFDVGARLIALLQLAKDAIDFAKENNHDVIILDSAGRLQIDIEMMAELLLIDRTIEPSEKLLVIDSMIGQEAANVGAAFDTQIGVTGIILTKLDGDARGGAALSITEEIKKPIKLIGIGEKIDDLQEFYPERIAGRILGMGDVVTLVEQAQEKIEEKEAEELGKKLLSGGFNFDSFLQAQNMFSKLGNFSSVFNMLGMGNMMSKFGINMDKETQGKILTDREGKMKKYKPLIQSMTKKERLNPDLLNSGRKTRIASGAGLKMKDVDGLVSEFRQTKKVMDKISPLVGISMEGGIPGPRLPSKSSFQTPRSIGKGFKPKKKK